MRIIRLLLGALVPASTGETSPALSMTNYCPDCRSALTPGVYTCPQCRLQFKDEQTAVRRSWLIPGGGLFCTGHRGLGVLHALVEVGLLFDLGFQVLVALGVTQGERNAGAASPDADAAMVFAVILAALLGLEKWVMARVARNQVRNYLPRA